MECLIHLMSLCVFDPSNVYLTAGIENQFHDGDRLKVAQSCYGTAYCVRDQPPGAHGTLKLGVSNELSRTLTLDYGIGHRSYIDYSRDHGQEFAFAQLTWKPFR